MIIMKIVGGFASQLSKYALGYSIAEYLNLELVLDLSDYYCGYFRPYSLCYLKLPEHRILTERDIPSCVKNVKEVKNSEDMKEMFACPNRRNYWINREEDDYRKFLDENQGLEICVNSKALDFFSLNEQLDCSFKNNFCGEVFPANSVAVHVRRGDFLKLGWGDQEEFYKAAIAFFSERIKGVQFYFFSNDIKWVKNEFGVKENFHYISASQGNLGDVEETLCMAHCRYRILSRFSGYGILANILSAYWGRGGYALMNGSGEYEKDANLSEQQKEFYRNLKFGEIIEYNRGGIYYLSSENIKYYLNYWEDSNKQSDSNLVEKVAWNINKYRFAGKYEMVRECLESVDCFDIKDVVQDWEKIYGISARITRDIYIVTKEYKNYWRIEGLYLLALMLGRLGNKVYYLNCNPRSEKNTEKLKWASNPDGKRYPFRLCGWRKDVGFLLKEIPNQSIVITDFAAADILRGIPEKYLIIVDERGRYKKIKRINLIEIIKRFQLRKRVLYLPAKAKVKGNSIKMPYDFFSINEMRWIPVIYKAQEIDGEENAK